MNEVMWNVRSDTVTSIEFKSFAQAIPWSGPAIEIQRLATEAD
jgi:hypothetical protein